MIRVLITDDHAILRKGLIEILVQNMGDVTCGEARNAEQAIAQVRAREWDLLIMDIAMPGRSGVDVLRDLKKEKPHLPVLILSMYSEDQYGKRVLQAGASGYVSKDSPPKELIRAVRKVLAGGRYVSSTMAEKLAGDLDHHGEQRHSSLSDRELEVLRMFATGMTVSGIAEELHLSVTTVSTYRVRILEKMSMETTAQLMHYALSNHLID